MLETGFADKSDFQIDMGNTTDESDTYGVFALKQNRQITTGRMQYFDTPYLGVLVYVTSIQPN